jgi:integrase
VGVAYGTATPLKAHLEAFLAEKTFSPRYKDDIRRAVGRLATWCAKGRAPETLEGITRKVAGEFITTGLTALLADRRTMNRDISALSSYWRWLAKRGHVSGDAANPWVSQSFDVPRAGGLAEGGKERSFTADEAVTLLYGPASPRLRDVMWIGALSGMRLDEVCRLQVRDCARDVFAVNARRGETGEGKSDAARRDVPIHTLLADTVARCSKGKKPAALLIDGLPHVDPAGLRKASAAVGQEFTRYRRKLGVDDTVAGRRRALVNFHSWRRWFVTAALHAGHPVHVVAAVVGHEDGRRSVTLGYNPEGPSAMQRRAVVASVQPPSKRSPADNINDAPGEDGRKPSRAKPSARAKGLSHES